MESRSTRADDHTAVSLQGICEGASDTALPILPADRELARLARAIAHPARVAIVRYLLQLGECVCTDLSEVVPLAHSTTMQHLKILKQAGLLRSTRDGRHVLYCVDGIVGMKSYGRAPTFLLATGYEQVRSVVAALLGDHAAAAQVELQLSQTGVCSADPSPTCGGEQLPPGRGGAATCYG